MIIISIAEKLGASTFMTMIIAVMAWFGIFIISPIEDDNKSYENTQRLVLKKKSIVAVTLLLIFSIVFQFAITADFALIIALSMFSVFLGMIYVIVRRHRA